MYLFTSIVIFVGSVDFSRFFPRTDTQKLERREKTLKEMLEFIPGV